MRKENRKTFIENPDWIHSGPEFHQTLHEYCIENNIFGRINEQRRIEIELDADLVEYINKIFFEELL